MSLYQRTGSDSIAPPLDLPSTVIRAGVPTAPPASRTRVTVYRSEEGAMSREPRSWRSDAGVSRPTPPPPSRPVLVDFGGFGFTAGGIAPNLSEADMESLFGGGDP